MIFFPFRLGGIQRDFLRFQPNSLCPDTIPWISRLWSQRGWDPELGVGPQAADQVGQGNLLRIPWISWGRAGTQAAQPAGGARAPPGGRRVEFQRHLGAQVGSHQPRPAPGRSRATFFPSRPGLETRAGWGKGGHCQVRSLFRLSPFCHS